MTDLAAWLIDRIAEDEAAARAAKPGPWRWEGDKGHHGTYRLVTTDPEPEVPEDNEWTAYYDAWARRTVADGTACDDYGAQVAIGDPDAAHIARWDPARVLAECEAKRRIVKAYEFETDTPPDGTDQPPAMVLRLLAAVYADRPGYDPAWAAE